MEETETTVTDDKSGTKPMDVLIVVTAAYMAVKTVVYARSFVRDIRRERELKKLRTKEDTKNEE